MNAPLCIALAQLNSTLGDLAGNANLIISTIEKAKSKGADLVVFPELALCGYPPEDLLLKRSFLETCRAELERVVANAAAPALVGFPELDSGNRYNAAAFISNGRIQSVYRKVELPNYGVFDEKRYFLPGNSPVTIDIGGTQVAVSICEDIWVPGGLAEQWAAGSKPQATINISASPFHIGKLDQRLAIARRFAAATQTPVVYVNLVGGQDELVFDGASFVVDSSGAVLGCGRRFEEKLLFAEVSDGGIKMDQSCPRQWGQLEEIFEALVLGTRDYIRKVGAKKVVIGLSGGIDSSLVAAIAVEALGKENVAGVTMPSQYSSKETRSDAEILARNLGIDFLEVPIKGVFDSTIDSMHQALKKGEPGIELENLQARIRGNILMTLSNKYGWIVLSTGNKSEMAVGYSTLYGDMCGGYAVIKDVPKTWVFELARLYNQKNGRDVIPQSVIDRPPTAELRPNQKDEDSLPPYVVLDPILQAYVEEDLSPADIVARGFDSAVVSKVIRLVDFNEFKRRQAPPGVKITPKAFGRDRRMPIANAYRP